MARSLNVKVIGVRKTITNLIVVNKIIDLAVTEGIKKSTKLVKEEVINSVKGRRPEPRSILSGDFLRSIDSINTKDEGRIFSDVEHSMFLEFGTTRIPQRRHFRNSLDRKKPEISSLIRVEVQRII